MGRPAFLNKPISVCCLAVDQQRSLPPRRAIYLVFARERLLYIGATMNLRARWMGHHRITDFLAAGYTRIAWIEIPERRWRLTKIEDWLIHQLQPTLNSTRVLEPKSVSIRILAGTHRRLKLLAAQTDKRIYTILDELVPPITADD